MNFAYFTLVTLFVVQEKSFEVKTDGRHYRLSIDTLKVAENSQICLLMILQPLVVDYGKYF